MVLKELQEVVGVSNIITDASDLVAFSYDASLETGMPQMVVIPDDSTQISEIVKILHDRAIPFIARGSGTGYSGGSVPTTRNEVIIQLSRLNKIFEIDYDNEYAIVEPGVINQELNDQLEGYRYIPDPASKDICTIGGNVAENAGGPYCLAYGVTQNYILELDVVLPDGKQVTLDNSLMNLFIGSEGILGIVTRIKVKLCKLPDTARCLKVTFDNNHDAAIIVSEIIKRGILPAALEMVTAAIIPGVETKDKSYLLIGLEGSKKSTKEQIQKIKEILMGHSIEDLDGDMHDERGRLYKKKIEHVQNLSGTNKRFLVDGVVPRNKLPKAIEEIRQLSIKHDLPVINTFHAGDGNIHPSIFYKVHEDGDKKRVEELVDDIMKMCLSLGGSLAGEHGIGLEKMRHIDMAFTKEERDFFSAIKTGLDPKGICNPGKGI